MTLTQLYMFTVILPNAGGVVVGLSIAAFITALVTAIGFIPAFIEESENAIKIIKGIVKTSLISGVILSILSIALPTQQQLYLLAGGYVATNTKEVEKLPDNVVKAANAWLEKAATLADDGSKSTKKN